MKPAPTLSAATADIASSLLRLLRTAPGGSDERAAAHRLQAALCTFQLDSSPTAITSLVDEALAAGWDRHPERAPLRSLPAATAVATAPAKAKGRWGFLR